MNSSTTNLEYYHQILNAPTLMPMNVTGNLTHDKENFIHTSTTSLQGTKILMYNYWEKNKKEFHDTSNKSKLSRTAKHQKSENVFPKIKIESNDGRLGAYIKAKEKEKQLFINTREEQVQESFHTLIKIEQYRIENDDKDFLKFQKIYYKRWEEILSLLKGFEKFTQHYRLPSIFVQSKLLFQLIEKVRKGLKLKPHDFLNCCENAQKISETNYKKAGIRFYGNKGFIRAVIKIQCSVRKWIQVKKYKKSSLQWKSAKVIQQFYRSRLQYKKTKTLIFNKQIEKLQTFKKIQQEFIENYRKKQITEKIRYEVHIPSHNLSEWQKVSSQKYIQKQNSQLCRIFKIANKNHLHETRIIYVSPVSLPKEILNYYNKLFDLGSEQSINYRLTIVTPKSNSKLPISLSPTQHLYYCPKTLRKIKKIIGNSYAYIVPSTPSNDYIFLCNQLNIPLYGSNPQKLSYLSTKSGCKYFQQSCEETKEEGFGILPYSINIYNIYNFLNELTNLIFRYPYIKRWILKIDNQINSRGIAYIDISKIISKSMLKKLMIENITKSQQKSYREEIYQMLENCLIINKEEKIITLNKDIYPSQDDYLKYYFTRGGIIEASINNFQTELENVCFTIDIQPDGEWKFLTNYYKITNKHKTIAAYFDSNINQPSLQLYKIIEKLKKSGYFGYFTLQFFSMLNNQHPQKETTKVEKLYYLNSIECNLNELSSAHYLKEFISKDSNALFIPILEHPCLLDLRIQTFFHLCRLQNISFDIEKKIGNIFLFLDGLQCGCIGMMTFNSSSKANCFTHSAEVLDFLNSKVKQSLVKEIPNTFFSIKNAVNGYLNRTKKMKLAFKHSERVISQNSKKSSSKSIQYNHS